MAASPELSAVAHLAKTYRDREHVVGSRNHNRVPVIRRNNRRTRLFECLHVQQLCLLEIGS